MAFPEEVLGDGERLLVHQRPHPKLLLLPALVFVLVCGVSGYLAAVLHRASWWGIGALVLVGAALAVIGWFSVLPLARWFSTHFVITDRRVLVREGVLSRSGFEIPVGRVDGVHYRQGMVDRVFGCGTLGIESDSDSDGAVYFDDIPHVVDVHDALQEAVAGAVGRID